MRRILFTLFLTLPLVARAQSTEDALKARLLRQPLYLRQTLAPDKLHFDPAGAPLGKPPQTSFTLSGIRVESIKLKPSELQLTGVRVGLDYAGIDPRRVVLQVYSGRGADTKDEEVKLNIDAAPGGDYGPALDAIFTTNLADLVPTLPLEWQSFARTGILHEEPAAKTPCSSPCDTRRVGGGITAPKVLSMPEPEFTNPARVLRKSGKVRVYLQVDTAGQPGHIRILRPTGLGLDEQAVLAVRQYKFQPAMENGKPVPVELNVEVNFQIF